MNKSNDNTMKILTERLLRKDIGKHEASEMTEELISHVLHGQCDNPTEMAASRCHADHLISELDERGPEFAVVAAHHIREGGSLTETHDIISDLANLVPEIAEAVAKYIKEGGNVAKATTFISNCTKLSKRALVAANLLDSGYEPEDAYDCATALG